jgi:hypothetical protein
MIPSITRNGSSFRGAGAYYLHDKAEAGRPKLATSERVAWTTTRNLVHEEPQAALDEMWRTADDAAHLKTMSGHDHRGRKNDSPVKALSLSWAPHQSPVREQMETAGDSFLMAMGWHEHQALFVAHNDEPHPHLHIILNRVHPETGLTLNDWQDRKRAQKWALGFEKEEGQILCLARLDKYEKGLDLEPNGMPYPYAKLIDETERAFDNRATEAVVLDRLEKDLLAERHREEREDFLASGKAQFRQARQAAYREVRDEFKPQWREHHRDTLAAEEQLRDDTKIAHRDAVRLAREGDHDGAARVLADLDEHRAAIGDGLGTDRATLRQQQLETTRDRQDEACRALITHRGEAFQEIKDRQKEERTEFKALQQARDAGAPYDFDRLQELLGQDRPLDIANDNRAPVDLIEAGDLSRHPPVATEYTLNPFTQQAHEMFGQAGHGEREAKAPSKDVSDIAVAGIGAVIEFGVRVMEGLFSSPSPREQAIAKAWAIREAQEAPEREKAKRDEKTRNDFTRHALTAVREAEAEQEKERKLDHEERGRSRYRER